MSKRALLVGCNYPGTSATLRGCINDVKSMYSLLTECYGFSPQNISVLVDDGTSPQSPTGANIKKYLMGLVAASQPGDVAVFHFSGHGTQIRDKDGQEHDNKDEAIVPTDMNLICDDDLRLILGNMAQGVNFTMISDCCHSGSMLDHPQQQISGNKDPTAPPGVDSMNPTDILGMFFKEAPGGTRDFGSHDQDRNRSLPQNLFCQLLGQQFGTSVLPGQIHSMLSRSFGNDASAKSLNYLGLLQQGLAAMQAMGVGTREFPPPTGEAAHSGTREFAPIAANANSNANANEGTRAYGDGGNRAQQGGTMACFMMVLSALMKMKTKPSNQSGYGGGGYGGGGGGMWGAPQQQYHQSGGYGGGGGSGYGGGGGMYGGHQQQQQQHGGYGGNSGYGSNTGGGGGILGSLLGGGGRPNRPPNQHSGYGGNTGGGGMWGAPQQQPHHSSGYGGGYGGSGGGTGAGGLLGALMGGMSGVNSRPPTGASGGGYGGAQGGYGGAPGGYGGGGYGGPGGEARSATGVLITGCQDHETSADACPSGDPSKAFGALTNALVTSVRAVKRNNPSATPTYKQLVQDVRSVMLHAKYAQNPCLECDTQHVDAPFIC